MGGHLYHVQNLLKNGPKSDSFADHYRQHFKYNTSRTELCKCMTYKLVKQLNPIVEMK